MIEEYKRFLANKDQKNFWKKAKQKEYSSKPVEQIFKDLSENFRTLTTRNSITLRYLGLVINRGSDKLEISQAGHTFLNSPYKQKILDEQLMKVYLDCPELNPNISIKIIPLKVILALLKELRSLTFIEYQLFVCWINHYEEIPLATKLILNFRKTKQKSAYFKILKEKSRELEITDFEDNIKRFFDMMSISSYFRIEKFKNAKIISSNLRREDIAVVLQSFDEKKFKNDNYFEYLTVNDGWKIYSKNPSYIKVIESLDQKSSEERQEIIKEIVGEYPLPNLNEINPVSVNFKISPSDLVRETASRTSPVKIDFEDRDRSNRIYGSYAEKIVCKFEKESLLSQGLNNLASKVKQLSLEDDSLGYDVLSFDPNGTNKHIEVKAVQGQPKNIFRFFISRHEIDIAKSDKNYFLYIVFDYLSDNPKVYAMPNPFIEETPGVTIIPIKYTVMVEISYNPQIEYFKKMP